MTSETCPVHTYVFLEQANPLLNKLLQIVAAEAEALVKIRDGRYTRSQDVEKLLRPALLELGFQHAVTSRDVPRLFANDSDFEIDFYHPVFRVALEVEKGKHFNVWRDVCKFVESEWVDHAVLLIPYEKFSNTGRRESVLLSTVDSLSNAHRLYLALKSFLLIGY